MDNFYKTTALEDWVINRYTRIGILRPEHIDIKFIAKNFDITINISNLPSTHVVNGRFRGIYLNRSLSKEMRREVFFHEFCHIQRHAGVQSNMPNPFRELQEWDAKTFTLYATIPYHMIQFIPFDEPGCIEETAHMFRITSELAEERIEMIKRRMDTITNRLHNPFPVSS